MLLIFLEILGVFGGTLVVIGGLSTWLGNVWAKRILQSQINNHNIQLENLKGNLQKEIDRSKNQLDVLKESSVRYSEFQFRLYNELWGELYSLEIIADALWEKADYATLSRFVEQFKKTKDQIKKNALLIEEGHLSELLHLLDEFGSYQFGKGKLIELRKNNNYYNESSINDLIKSNGLFKQRYSAILLALSGQFRRQIKFYQE